MAACLRILTVKMLTGSLIAKYLVKPYPVKLRVISTKAPVGPVILMVQTVIICILFLSWKHNSDAVYCFR